MCKTQGQWILGLVEGLPYFSVADLAGIEKKHTYLKILLSRYKKSGKIIRLKKGLYVAEKYVSEAQKKGYFNDYLMFIACLLNESSYLSLEWVLYKHNILTEMPVNFTCVTTGKTVRFKNKLGLFIYHHLKPALFLGYKTEVKNQLTIRSANVGKALFDFIYLRKNYINSEREAVELRLNLTGLAAPSIKELKYYARLEGSKKVFNIINWLL